MNIQISKSRLGKGDFFFIVYKKPGEVLKGEKLTAYSVYQKSGF
jgi:hypothetical protein